MTTQRTVAWFSCGAASAVATLLAAIKSGGDIEAVYCRVVEEHEDNLRFLDDFTRVTGIPVKTITNKTHQGSIYNVFGRRGYIKNQYGAPCTMILKKDMRKAYQRPGDIQVFGYTVDEQQRADDFLDSNNDVRESFPLIDNKINKQDCYRYVRDTLGIELPAMYRLGYGNNNCIGCVKGGMGYWNKIRVDFPMRFNQMAQLERKLNFSVCKDRKGMVFLDELDPKRGNPVKDAPTDCGFTCEAPK
jgi:3'-phosphoadenosine 5'-phosphosulfate sulfotransferase (PAPS reductase)/FAD synthetase